MLPLELQEQISKLPKEARSLFQTLVTFYETKIHLLEERVKTLEDRLSENSRNSNKPPSSDGYSKPSPNNSREKSTRKPGGQKGRQGTTLKRVAKPDRIERHVVQRCEYCQADLSDQHAERFDARQVFDIPPLQIEVTEHQAETKTCRHCRHINKAPFPADVSHYVQYGGNLKAFLAYMMNYQMLPYARMAEFMQDFFGHSLSVGTAYNIQRQAYEQLASFEEHLKCLLSAACVAGFDETGVRVVAKLMWLHLCNTDRHAYYAVDKYRGQKAMDTIGILPDFEGVALHDFWKSYYQYHCRHAICNAHILRELLFIQERFHQPWATELIKLLLNIKKAKQHAKDRGKTSFSEIKLNNYKKQYDAIIRQGFLNNPMPNAPPNTKRGRPPKSKALNLLERLRDFSNDILRFMYDFRVPFDNNGAERDLRMMKVKQKISGSFRSINGAQHFARIRSYIVTARKQDINVFRALKDLFTQNEIARLLVNAQ